jgi:hypothetical protein
MTMDRRTFLRRSAIVATGAVAADEIELLEKLGDWTRRFFPSAAFVPDASPFGYSVMEMAAIYQRTSFAAYRAFARRLDDYVLNYRVPASELIIGSGVENRIPLEDARDRPLLLRRA